MLPLPPKRSGSTNVTGPVGVTARPAASLNDTFAAAATDQPSGESTARPCARRGVRRTTGVAGSADGAASMRAARAPNGVDHTVEPPDGAEVAGAAIQTVPGENGAGTLEQGYLERSNVDIASELINLIIAQRAYETNSRAISTADQMMQTANAVVR